MVSNVIPEPSLRACLGRFATGVAVVTFGGDDGPRGITINSFTSVSIEPPLVLASIARRARSHDALKERPFCVNILSGHQQAVATCFAGGPATDELVWADPAPDAVAPAIVGALAHLQCTPWAEYDGGDHTLFLGQVVAFDYVQGAALGFHANGFASGFTTIGAADALGSEALL